MYYIYEVIEFLKGIHKKQYYLKLLSETNPLIKINGVEIFAVGLEIVIIGMFRLKSTHFCQSKMEIV